MADKAYGQLTHTPGKFRLAQAMVPGSPVVLQLIEYKDHNHQFKRGFIQDPGHRALPVHGQGHRHRRARVHAMKAHTLSRANDATFISPHRTFNVRAGPTGFLAGIHGPRREEATDCEVISGDDMSEDTEGRRALLKMAMLGGGAALAGLMRQTAEADPSPKDQQAQADLRSRYRAACRHRASRMCASYRSGGGGVSDSTVVKVETGPGGPLRLRLRDEYLPRGSRQTGGGCRRSIPETHCPRPHGRPHCSRSGRSAT